MLPRAISFDLDGTLIDSRGDIAASCNHVLEWAGRAPLPVDVVSGFVGDGARTLLARAFGIPRESPEIEPLLAEWVRYYVAHPVPATRWLPGAERVLKELPARGVKVALVTNKQRVVTLAILEALGVTRAFDAIYAGGDGPLKPSGEPVLRLCTALGILPGEMWIVGDAEQDVLAAHAAGARSVAVLGGFQPDARVRAAGPDDVYPSLAAFAEAVLV